ncbi:acyltransferase family protein [Sphingobium nicotianae]|uniref:Acyltransferase family protein n=1 Tax=Sphingobium nicotianae TaxID=2782607 RepID=A0A9X1D9H1_9SPHN|nr:acyltransferase family protein [Sphingobium nicotianae]MBT2185898.1 acyltransferase family protein [Sphingobium nicotianae]
MTGESGIRPESCAAPRTPAARARLEWVDALKGVGIVAVVAGHVWTRGPVRDAIYVVHMPLFFMLSGYTSRHAPWPLFLRAGLRGLALPFLCFSILLLGADFLIEGLRGVRPIFATWGEGATTILFATEKLRGPFTILWFVPCLFLARLIWNALIADGRRADAAPVLAAMLIVGLLSVIAHHPGHSPFGLLAVPGALIMIWAGALWRQWGQPPAGILAGLALLTVAALVWFPPMNMKFGDFGWPILSLAAAAAITLTLARVVQSLPLVLIAVLAALGRASLVIMYAHVAFIHYLAPYAPRPALFVVALGFSFLIDRLVRRFEITRRLLLGQPKTPR